MTAARPASARVCGQSSKVAGVRRHSSDSSRGVPACVTRDLAVYAAVSPPGVLEVDPEPAGVHTGGRDDHAVRLTVET